MDKANNDFRQYFIILVFVILTGLMVTAGCGNNGDNTRQKTETAQQNPDQNALGGQDANLRPKDLDILFTTNNCVSCDLSNWHITQLDLSNADLTKANLTNTDLTHSNLTNANLTNANLTGTNLTSIIMVSSNLTNANLINANLTNARLTYANLTGANLTGAKLDGAILDYAILTGAIWVDGSTCGLSSNNGRCEP